MVRINDVETLKRLLANLADDNDLGRHEWLGGSAPFHLAAVLGLGDMVQVLVDKGVDVNSFVVSDADRDE